MNLTKEQMHLFNFAASSDVVVLITGPTGTGKTRLARMIHDASSRRDRPFVSVNLATLHEGTVESELFGHERGAFTGADGKRTGRLESANTGTVFLDEIGDLAPRLQARLLDFLQHRTIVPVGGNKEQRLDVRIIAATNHDLPSAVREGRFREDLFHRLRVIGIKMKSLYECPDGFDAIVHECLSEICFRAGKSVLRISEEFARRLEEYSWPGNIRELRNILEYAVLVCQGVELQAVHLPPWFGDIVSASDCLSVSNDGDFYTAIAGFERAFLERALKRFGWAINKTARGIGISKTTLLRRMKTLGLRWEDHKNT
ncbi:MAG: hypothetical protein A2583_08485 [Bdellovibrionales bacterium RIFOXYD1_FULL_53_11]|nr:MAG: hypothetical protein A2583_08485 [Bdellovibrionales bacterium RIFOXYD1_FULL_53_11]